MDHMTALIDQNNRFADLIGDADPATEVPTCPGWTLKQLFRHVGRGDRWSAQIISDRVGEYLDPREVRDGKPPADTEGALAWLREGPRILRQAVDEIGPDTHVWTFSGPRPAEWWVRRRLHEATVHRADAALALGLPYDLPADLAADGIEEWIDTVASSRPTLDPGVTVHLHTTDVPGEWMLRGEEDRVVWEVGHGKGDLAVRGPAADLFLALVNRREGDLEVFGDEGIWRSWRERARF
ncbi:maleylpyruvate isomerase family mycothiol-dependent enzyme [Herbidospora yilanensis]|uniref:maleylpyruvate isomerase family mycothiol-dependent enzyme n=1 Tax=Herbidospora yilanensis TaxID=354426 RepID=UPI000784105D|nr:maleylpyruvate isomerase family mycothiol-dependent enzyme [Herbidospora yilanensis]